MVFDPIPDPIAAGWTKEGDEPHLPASTALMLHDTTNSGFIRFYVEDPPAFGGDIELAPTFDVRPGFSVDAEGSTGVHVAINDGDREVRADILGTPAGGIRVALRLKTGYSSGFVLPTMQASFQVKRLADGSGLLAVAGQAPEIMRRLDLAASRRFGVQTLEFGADNRGGVVSTEWFALLPANAGRDEICHVHRQRAATPCPRVAPTRTDRRARLELETLVAEASVPVSDRAGFSEAGSSVHLEALGRREQHGGLAALFAGKGARLAHERRRKASTSEGGVRSNVVEADDGAVDEHGCDGHRSAVVPPGELPDATRTLSAEVFQPSELEAA